MTKSLIRVLFCFMLSLLGMSSALGANFLTYPFSNPGVEIVQGWEYNYSSLNHCGIDYRNGGSSWLTFEVQAPANGYYSCHESGTWGYYALGRHVIGDTTYYTVHAHLESCNGFESGDKQAGDYLGMAGHTGTASNGITHLHFEIGVNEYGQPGCDESVDPYDIRSTVDQYPENGGSCGPNYLWTQCLPVMADEAPTPTTGNTHLITVAPTDSGQFNLFGYEVTGSGDDTELTPNAFSYLNTGTYSYNDNGWTSVQWLVGHLNNDDWDDVVQVRTRNDHSYAHVYTGNGAGGLNNRDRWKKTAGNVIDAFLGDIDGDGLDDLILVFANSDSTLTWEYFLNNGTGFDAAVIWSANFGTTDSINLVGDFNGNGQAEALAGMGTPLTWQRLNTSFMVTTLSTAFGLTTDEFVVANTDDDVSDEIVRIDERNSTVEVEAAHYFHSTGTLTITVMAADVGGTDGDYAIYLLDSTGSYPDLIRSNGTTLYLASGNGTSFEEQGNQSIMVPHDDTPALTLTDDQSALLFGNFGTSISTQAIDGDPLDLADNAEESITPPSTPSPGISDPAPFSTDPSLNPATWWFSSLNLQTEGPVDYIDPATDPFGYVNPDTGQYRLVFTGADGNIYQQTSTAEGYSGTWVSTTLSAYAWVPYVWDGTSTVPIFNPMTGDEEAIFTAAVDCNIWTMTIDGGTGGITSTNIGSLVWIPCANGTSDPHGYFDPDNGDFHVVYADAGQGVQLLIRKDSSGAWTRQDLSEVSGWNIQPGTSPQAFMDPISGYRYILFTGTDLRVKLLISENNVTWGSVDLTSQAAVDYSQTTPVGFIHPITGRFYVYFIGIDRRIYELRYDDEGWHSQDLTALTGVPYADLGSGLSAVANPVNGDILVTFQGDNHRINQLRRRNGDWTARDVTSLIPVEYAQPGATPQMFVDPFTGAETTIFVGNNSSVQLIRLGPAFTFWWL